MSGVQEGIVEDLEELGPELLQAQPLEAQAPPPVFEPASVRGQRARLVLGPALAIFGVWIWAYAVIGQLVVALEFPEALGFIGLLLAIGIAWTFAVRQSFQVEWPTAAAQSRRTVLPFALSFAFFAGSVLFATLLGALGSSMLDPLITVLLCLVGVAAIIRSRKLTDPDGVARADASRRAMAVLLWAGASVVTLIAVLTLFS